ncbi:YegP family protein [Bacillota bacterium Meth-B3]
MEDRWEFYQDAAGQWRWRRIAPNGKIVGASSEGFSSKQACVENAKRNGYPG